MPIVKHYIRFISVVAELIVLLLIYYALVSTTQIFAGGDIFYLGDSVIYNILMVVAFVIIINLIKFFVDRNNSCKALINSINDNKANYDKCEKVLLCVIMLLGIIWVLASKTGGRSDDKVIQQVVYATNLGNYEAFETAQYMDRFPNQIGYFLYSYLFSVVFGQFSYIALQIVNVFGLVIFYKETVEILVHLKFRPVERLIYLIIGISFYPLIMYTAYAYGTILGLCLSAMAIRYELAFFSSKRFLYCPISALCISIACFLKNNYLIFAIGMLIYAVIYIISNFDKAKKGISFLVLCITMISIIITIPKAIGLGGQSGRIWIAMGLTDGNIGPGWSDSVDQMYYNNPTNKELQNIEAMDVISNRFHQFKTDPGYALDFFTRKNASQWNAPLFQASYVNAYENIGCNRSYWAKRIVDADMECILIKLMNYWHIICLVGVLLYIVQMWNEPAIEVTIFPSIFIGGFIFYTFWEASARYTIPHFAIIIPLAVKGYSLILLREKDESSASFIRYVPHILCVSLFILIVTVYCLNGNSEIDDSCNIRTTFLKHADKILELSGQDS